jgi:hypothetical protein
VKTSSDVGTGCLVRHPSHSDACETEIKRWLITHRSSSFVCVCVFQHVLYFRINKRI